MAAYYPAPRHHAPPVPASPVPYLPSPRRRPSIHLTDSPTYIFPHPSSAPPSPNPSHSSHISEQSDISLSVISFSELGSLENSPLLTQPEHPLFLRQPLSSSESPLDSWPDAQGHIWKLRKRPRLDPIPFDPAVITFNNDEVKQGVLSGNLKTIPPHSFNLPTAGVYLIPLNRAQQSPVLQQPLLPRSIPLLSFFSSLLSVDGSTLDLLTLPPPSDSILFPNERCLGADAGNDVEMPTEKYGLERLFSAIQAEKGCQNTRRGLLSLNDIPVGEFCVVPLPDLWFAVTKFMSSGRRFLHQVSGRLVQAVQTSG
ncbi:hypothetical protein D9756_004905 [Leucocoprinus leucothites]|uniref:Uncharacterized protein n=1 Tax=Leucocoprinus leucothites TaxID=201217 RepID=A0A8H5LKU5_9AGAR|nr:hypothetical protein D9756_004905 [Leucoagaricus leucothites]